VNYPILQLKVVNLNRYYSTWMKKGGSGCIGWLYSMLSRNESDGLYLENHILTVTHSVNL